MRSRRFFSYVLHLLLAAGLVLPGIAAPGQAVSHALAAAGDNQDPMSASPCSGMSMPDKSPPHTPMGGDHGCDLAACLGAGCLPTLPHVAAFVPDSDVLIPWDQPVPPSRLVERPLRPPIA